VNSPLFDKLQNIKNDQPFINAKKFRNSVTHNFLPNSLGSDVQMPTENLMTFGDRTYIPSAAFKANVIEALNLFADTLEVIKAEVAAEHTPANLVI